MTQELKRLKEPFTVNLDTEHAPNLTESLIESIRSGIIITQMDDTITYINRTGETLLGYSKHEVIGKPFHLFELKEKQTTSHPFFDQSDDMDTRREGRMRKKDGQEIPVGFTINYHLNQHGKAIGKIIIFRDLTKVYRIQEEILKMDRLVSLGKLASGIAHEIRNPLAGIKTTAQALGDEMPKEDPKREYLNRITKEIDRLNEILKTFFSFAKPQALLLVPCHIKEIINAIIPFLIREIADKGIRFTETYHPQLPKIKADKIQMHQAFLNLFLNAIQAMPNGGDLSIEANPISIPSSDGTPQRCVRVRVSDSGKGIPPHILPKIFDPFFTTKPKGIGLGLSITYQIINKHGGTIEVDSRWGEGTSFIVTLPEMIEPL